MNDHTPTPAALDERKIRGWTGPSAIAVASTLAIARFVVPLVAAPYALRATADATQSIPLLILLRPGRLELLLAGFRVRTGDADLLLTALAYLPMGILSVWGFFWLGRLMGPRLENSEGWMAKAVPPDTFRKLERLVERKGTNMAVFGRVAGLPPTLMAAAAATSRISARRYLAADMLGAVITVTIVLIIGAALGETYERAGRWFSIGGFVLIFIGMSVANAWVQRELNADEPELDTDADDPAEF